MLTEQFIASVGVPEKPVGTHFAKDAAIFIHEYQPAAAQKAVLKKSATPQNCLAVSESHVFAAQADKGVVHVYSREKNNQEATVPFPERITCLALACDDSVLVLGTAEGRIFLWECCTGRQIATEQSHLQKVTALAVDPTSNFLCSASADSVVHVWSLPGLLSFSNAANQSLAPRHTFTSHRAEVSALVLGHSSRSCNFAVSTSKDKVCLVWDYHTTNVLRTILLSSVPTSLALDAADRHFFVGYEDGSIHHLDLTTGKNATLDSVLNAHNAVVPIQPSQSSLLSSPDTSHGAVLSITLSFDGCTMLTGHESGAILAWDCPKGRFQSTLLQLPLPGPVTNLKFLPVEGLKGKETKGFRITSVVKPKFGAFDGASGGVPGNYTLQVQLLGNNQEGSPSIFRQALTSSTFPASLIEEGLSELAQWGSSGQPHATEEKFDGNDDFMALDDAVSKPHEESLEEQNKALKAELESLRRVQQASLDKIERMNAERRAYDKREQSRAAKAKAGPNGPKRARNTDDNSSDED